ncbi:MAG: hypothetical protein EA351_03515 [Gemmatimonadales bacterium]|nr:MAG: hypothetical protein EA351_03515 [Gemmatimonadales bacterium]
MKVWTGENGTSDRVVAYLISSKGLPEEQSLRRHLAQKLPDVMIPTDYVKLDAFPLTPNAKVDRKRLPPPGERQARRGSGPAVDRSASELQRLIAAIWSEVLEQPEVGLDDNFFDLGGHSLLTVRVHSKLSSELDVRVSITDLFRHPTVRSLAAHLEGDGDDGEAMSDARDRAAARRDALRHRRRRRPS